MVAAVAAAASPLRSSDTASQVPAHCRRRRLAKRRFRRFDGYYDRSNAGLLWISIGSGRRRMIPASLRGHGDVDALRPNVADLVSRTERRRTHRQASSERIRHAPGTAEPVRDLRFRAIKRRGGGVAQQSVHQNAHDDEQGSQKPNPETIILLVRLCRPFGSDRCHGRCHCHPLSEAHKKIIAIR